MEIMSSRIAGYSSQLNGIKVEDLPHLEKLTKAILAYATRILSNHNLHKMMHRELSLPHRPEMFFKIKNAMLENHGIIEQIITDGIDAGDFRQIDVRMFIASLMGTISNVAINPAKITSGTTLDINNPEDRKVITNRLTTYLNDLITTYLTSKQ